MSNAAVRVANLIWRWRFPLSALCLGLSVLAASQLSSLAVSNSLEIWYPADDPELLNYRQFQRTYGNDEIVIAAVSRDDGFASEAATELIGSITDDLLDIDGVATVISLVTVPQSLGAARGRLLSDDGKTTALVLQMMAGEAFEARRHQILKDVAHAIEAHEMEPRLAGYGVVFDALNEESTTGTSTLLVYAHGLMLVLLAIFFRKWGAVAVTLLAVGNATLWTMGLYVLLGQKLSMITMVLPTLVLVIGIADCVHLLRSVAKQDRSLPQRERVVQGPGRGYRPVPADVRDHRSRLHGAGYIGIAGDTNAGLVWWHRHAGGIRHVDDHLYGRSFLAWRRTKDGRIETRCDCCRSVWRGDALPAQHHCCLRRDFDCCRIRLKPTRNRYQFDRLSQEDAQSSPGFGFH